MAWLVAGAIVAGACNPRWTASELRGVWRGPDGATISLLDDGRFTADRLPAQLLLDPRKAGRRLAGSGSWTLVRSKRGWEVRLLFVEPPEVERTGVSIIVERSGGAVGLFAWRDEEGGERWEVHR